jgi:superfamily II DNA or RNA helicase
MKRSLVLDIDVESMQEIVEAATFERGLDYAATGNVIAAQWEPSRNALIGVVRGSKNLVYATTVIFTSDEGVLYYLDSTCSCPVGVDCKHAVALAVASDTNVSPADLQADRVRRYGGASSVKLAQRGKTATAGPALWETSLGPLLDAGLPDSALKPSQIPLAIELMLVARARVPAPRAPYGYAAPPAAAVSPGGLRLEARLMQQGKNGWIAGQLAWSRLETLGYYGDYSDAQVRVLAEFYVTYQARSSRQSYNYYSTDEKRLDLTTYESRQLWPLLDGIAAAGVHLIYPRKLGAVRRHGSVALCLDITARSPDSLAIAPVILHDGAATGAVPLAFIGADGHGVVCADPAEIDPGGEHRSTRFWLAPLDQPVPKALRQLAVAGQRLDVPAADVPRFRDRYCPRLRRLATIISSDESFSPPRISGPGLALAAAFGPDHRIEARWYWTYQVGETPIRVVPGETGDPSYRDFPAERALLAGLAESGVALESYGLARWTGVPGTQELALTPGTLSGLGAMRFSTELLPMLNDHPSVTVEVTGTPADYREASDSLRISVSTAEVTGQTDWYDLGVSVTVDEREVPFAQIFMALSRGDSHLLLDDGAYFSLEKPELASLARLIEEARALHDGPPGELRISRFQADLWDELTSLGVISHQAAAWQRQIDGLLSLDAIERAELPAGLHAELRPYQLDGFQWLAFLWAHQLGGILADDMGLGKTLQALALICHARAAEPAAAPFLIIAPTSVVPNWVAEAGRFAPGLKIVAVTETEHRRGKELSALIAGADAVVTSYALLRIDFEAYSGLDWSGMILDEAQFAKNHQAKVYQCARRMAAPFKLAITGTPMENNLMELWALLSIAAPGLFPTPAKFSEYYAKPIERQANAELLGQLRRRIRPLVRRRTKEQVAADLPSKQEQVLEIELHPRHRKLYQTHLQRERQKVLGLLDDINANRFTIFRSLTLMRQLALHGGLVAAEHADLPSAKIDVLMEQLADVVGGGHRALVFSQFTGFLGKVRERLDAEGVASCYLDGSTRNRGAVLERFKEGTAPVFLISLKAGGFGLNLTEADYCFLLDPWWNPATEAQAVDRTHRIGQTRNVMVYRLIAKDTIEEKVMALKERKAELFASVLDSGGVFSGGLDAEDIRGLFA